MSLAKWTSIVWIQLIAAISFCGSLADASANTSIVYKEYFHSKNNDSVMSAWKFGQSSPHISRSPRGINFLGIFKGTDTIRLDLNKIPKHQQIMLDMGFHVIGSWDGIVDDDRFMVIIDGQSVINESFSNTTSKQSWPAFIKDAYYPPRAGARNSNMLAFPSRVGNDYIGPMDATYIFTRTISHAAASCEMAMTASLHNIDVGKEFKGWGLEYVLVYAIDTSESSKSTEDQAESPLSKTSYLETFDGKDVREVAEYVQDDDFPGVKSGSDFERQLHNTVASAECHSCGDYCLWYTMRFYTDGWINVWTNQPAKGKSFYSVSMKPEEVDTLHQLVASCLETKLDKEYHDSVYEDAHPDVTHTTLKIKFGQHDDNTEVYAGEPPNLHSLLLYLHAIVKRYGWEPIPN